jgi:hypothetical protein
MPVAIPLAIVGAGIAGAAGTAIAGSAAAGAAKSAASQNNALQSEIYSQNSANAQPYIQAGDNANTALQGFLGIGGDPAASKAALDNYLNSTGYQFTRDQGLDAAKSNAASSGMLNSGSTLEALDNYGAGVADQYGQQYEQNLQNVATTGENAAGALAGTGQSYANAVSSNNNSAAAASGNAALSGANSANGLIGNALNAFAYTKGVSSFGGAPNSSNAFATGSGDMIGG